MDVAAVMQEVADRLDTIDGLRVFAYPADSIAVPAAIVSYPAITWDETFGRGMDRFQLPVDLFVGKVHERSARDRIAAYARGSGPKSIKAKLDGRDYDSCDSVRVVDAEPGIKTLESIDYLVYSFNLDIAGPGG